MSVKKPYLVIAIATLTLCSCNKVKKFPVNFVTQTESHLTYVFDSQTAYENKDYTMSFKIDYTYELKLDDIHVTIDGIERNDSWTFLYQTNEKNIFTIKKEYIKGDIVVDAVATLRSSTQSKYGYLFGDEILAICDCRFSDDRKQEWIPTFDQNAYPVMEDEAIEVIITLKDGEEYSGFNQIIMDNIWFRTNARFAKLGVDFTKTYSEDHRTCTIKVPNYIIRDHGSFRVNTNKI